MDLRMINLWGFLCRRDACVPFQRLLDEGVSLRSQIEQFQRDQASALCKDIAAQLAVSPVLCMRVATDLSPLKDALLALRNDHPDMAVVLGSDFGGKPALTVCLGQQRLDVGLTAATLGRTAGKEIPGGGGGQPAYATAGGKNPEGLDRALEVVKGLLG